MSTTVVCALYRFVALENYQEIQQPLLDIMNNNNVKGTLLLASEGINGTIAGSRSAIDNVIYWLKLDARFENLTTKESFDENNPFYRTKVKLKSCLE